MKLKYRNGGRPDINVKSLLSALGENDKRGLNKLLNKQNRIDLANDEEEVMKMPYAYGGKMKVMKKGGLVGGQKKLDKNNDGKITGEDFKMLRSMMGGGKMEYMDGGKMEYMDGGKLKESLSNLSRENLIQMLLSRKMGS